MTKKTVVLMLIVFFSLIDALMGQAKHFKVEELQSSKVVNANADKSPLLIILSTMELTFPNSKRFAEKVVEKSSKSFHKYILRLVGLNPTQKSIPLQIASNGYLGETIQIKGLQRGHTTQYLVEDKQPLINTKLGEFYISTEPEGALVELFAQNEFNEKHYKTPYLISGKVAQGYKLTLKKKDYYEIVRNIFIDKKKRGNLKVKLKAKFGWFILDTDEKNELRIDGEIYSDHSEPIKVYEGRHTIKVTRKYFKDFTETINIVGQEYPPMEIEREVELERYRGSIKVTSEPSNAEVFIDGESIGYTPLDKTVNAGLHTLKVEKNDFRTETLTFEILQDETFSKIINLEHNGLLTITGLPGTSIRINGNSKGTLPLETFELPPGNYTIDAELDGYDTNEFSFDLKSEEKDLDLTLVETKDRFFRWTGFGNDRIASLSYSYVSLGYFKAPISPNSVFTLTSEMEEATVSGPTISFNIVLTPIEISGGGGGDIGATAINLKYTENDSISADFWYGNIDWTPFILWEKISPFIGIIYHNSNLNYSNNGVSSNKLSFGSLGLSYGFLFSWGEDFNIKFKNHYLFDKSVYGDYWSISFGISFRFFSDSYRESIKKK